MEILNSQPFKNYVEKKIYYKEIQNLKKYNTNEYDFTFSIDGESFIENFSNEYKIFMEKMKDSSFFINLFRLKYLPYGIRGITNSNLKIISNSFIINLMKILMKRIKK